MIERMAEIGRDHDLDTLIAPVRPTLKHRYPLTPIDRYLSWRRPDRTHLDPWLRTHERLGADIVKVASKSVVVTGTVAEWEEWTEMALPESGVYVVSGALVPIEIDRERDEGVYVEPNRGVGPWAPPGHLTLLFPPLRGVVRGANRRTPHHGTGGGLPSGHYLGPRGRGVKAVAVTSRCGTQSSTWLKPSKRPPSSSTTSKKERGRTSRG